MRSSAGGEGSSRVVSEPTTFEALFRDEYDRMVRVAFLICGTQTVAEELVQQGFLHVHRRWGELDSPAGYLRTCVVNAGRDDQRRSRRFERRTPLIAVEDRATDVPDAEDLSNRIDLVAALAKLPHKSRAALVLRFYGGFKEPEIAAALDVPPGTVKTLLRRGLQRLREEVRP